MANRIGTMPLIMETRIQPEPYRSDDTDKELSMWSHRVRTYFPDLYEDAVEFRFRQSVVDPKHRPKSVLVLEDDGSIFEVFVDTVTGSASAKMVSDSVENKLFD